MQSILVALERLRWMNGMDFSGRYVWVNIPDFSVRVVDDGKTTFRSVTVVGQNNSDRRTPEFSDEMERPGDQPGLACAALDRDQGIPADDAAQPQRRAPARSDRRARAGGAALGGGFRRL